MRTRRSRLNVALVGDDLSDGAALALQRAAVLPSSRNRVRAERAQHLVEVLQVIPARPARARRKRALEAAQLALATRADELVRSSRLAEAATPRIRASIVEGEPFVELIRQGRALDADLVVVGRHGRTSWRDAFVGTTVERIVRKGDVPVLVVKQPARAPYRRVVAAIEASDAGAPVLALSLTLMSPEPAAKLTVVHCITVPFETEISGGLRQAAARLRREYAQERTVQCRRIIDSVRGARSPPIELVVAHGDPRVLVLEEIERRRADLLVVGTHARSGVAHALLGSTAEALIRSARCDVAVTRPARFTFELP